MSTQVIPISEPGTTIRNIVIRETRSSLHCHDYDWKWSLSSAPFLSFQTFLHCVEHFNFSSLGQIFSDLRYVTLLPGPRMKSSCLRYFSTSYDHQLWSNIINYDDKLCSMMVLRFTRTRSHRLIFLQTSQPSQTPPAGKSTNTNTQKNIQIYNIQTKQFKSKVQKSLSCQLICFSH